MAPIDGPENGTSRASPPRQREPSNELSRRLPDEDSAEAEVLRRDGDERLWDAVERLSERCQALLRIVAFEHRPDYTTIAANLGMPVGSIGPTRGRCLQKLRALIETNGDHDE